MKTIALICTLMLVMSLAHKPSFAQQGATDTSSCAAHLNTSSKPPTLGDLLSCLAEMQREIDEVRRQMPEAGLPKASVEKLIQTQTTGLASKQQVDDLLVEIRKEIPEAGLPKGAVVAFDRPGVCPTGWTNMGKKWRGRVLVAAMTDANDTYGFGKTGGARKHQHTISGATGDAFAKPDGWKVDHGRDGAPQAAGLAHSHTTVSGTALRVAHMPPYIALYFCKKD